MAVQAALTGTSCFQPSTPTTPQAPLRDCSTSVSNPSSLRVHSQRCSPSGLCGRCTNRAKAAGCVDCLHSGFKGRIGIFELLVVDSTIHDLIGRRASALDIKAA